MKKQIYKSNEKNGVVTRALLESVIALLVKIKRGSINVYIIMHMKKYGEGLAKFHFSSSYVPNMDKCICWLMMACNQKRRKIYTVAFQVFIFMYMYIVKNVVIPTSDFIFHQ